MASVASVGTSPRSGYESHQADSPNDPDENLWYMINGVPGSSASSATGFSFSPASGSLSSWAMVGGHAHQIQPSPPGALSPLNLDFDQPTSHPASIYGETTSSAFGVIPAPVDGQFMSHNFSHDGQQFLAPGETLFTDHAFESSIGEAHVFLSTTATSRVLTSPPLRLISFYRLVRSSRPHRATFPDRRCAGTSPSSVQP